MAPERTALSAQDIADIDADLAARGLVRTSEPTWTGMAGRRTRAAAESTAIETAAFVDPERPQYRWIAWNVGEDSPGVWHVHHFVVSVEAVPAPEREILTIAATLPSARIELSASDIAIATMTDFVYGPRGGIDCKAMFGFTSLITPEGYAPKTDKGRARGYSTAIMYFAPADLSGYDVCQYRSAGCTASCLNTAGHGGIAKRADVGGLNDIQRARVARTRLFFLNRALFNRLLVLELTAHIAKAREAGMIPCVRLNGTSDLPWERLRLNDGRTVLETFPDVTFYDYTKHPDRAVANAEGRHPSNYHLTFSLSEANGLDCASVLEHGGNVAAVFKICGCSPRARCGHYLPESGMSFYGRPVVNGDHDDLRFLDSRGVVVGLKAKGLARIDTSGFVVDTTDRSN